jgi:hypothetical protein
VFARELGRHQRLGKGTNPEPWRFAYQEHLAATQGVGSAETPRDPRRCLLVTISWREWAILSTHIIDKVSGFAHVPRNHGSVNLAKADPMSRLRAGNGAPCPLSARDVRWASTYGWNAVLMFWCIHIIDIRMEGSAVLRSWGSVGYAANWARASCTMQFNHAPDTVRGKAKADQALCGRLIRDLRIQR